jgi:hypothetical protein
MESSSLRNGNWHNLIMRGAARHGLAWQGKARQGLAGQGKARQTNGGEMVSIAIRAEWHLQEASSILAASNFSARRGVARRGTAGLG